MISCKLFVVYNIAAEIGPEILCGRYVIKIRALVVDPPCGRIVSQFNEFNLDNMI